VTTQPASSARTYPGIVFAALIVAIAGGFAAVPAPALGAVLAAAGVWLSLKSRAVLRSQSELSGWGVSLTAMIIASLTLAGTLVFLLSPLVLSLLFLATGGMPS
jgi:hypothetical protein